MTAGARADASDSDALNGVRIVVTRAKADAQGLVEAFERHGSSVITLPTIETRPLASAGLDAALRGETAFDWTLFTSANTVRMVIQRAAELGLDPASLAQLGSVAAIGSATARDLKTAGIRVDLLPAHATAEGLADALIAHGVDGKRVFLPASRIARRVLRERLGAAGAEVVTTPVYDTVCPDRAPDDALAAIRAGEVEIVTFTSPSTVRNFLTLAGLPTERTIIASIGPVTTAEAVRLGLQVDITAGEHTAEGLVRAIVDHQMDMVTESENE